jgi:topoisomerase-4 subunit A
MMEENELNDNISKDNSGETPHSSHEQGVAPLTGMYKEYFIDYASYVILERAVPAIEDGLKPVQRRILHSTWELEDGRYNKVANIVGNTMKYHPHGDASINDAMVQLGQKELLIDTQGNWGNIMTGDSAAASRYIEARLTKFALDVVFNPKTTNWQQSYDGRNREPVTLPVKFPLLLAQGVEGIAVGLACKIMPHNFIELIDASIDILKGKKSDIMPDFPTGGIADFSKYNNGLRGGKIRVRSKISIADNKTLVITEIPFGTTTGSLIDSIVSANEKGKIKIRKVEDNTAQNVEILVHLPAGISPDKTIDALYAFTDCEMSISPNSCVIIDDKPVFLGVNDILQYNTNHTRHLLGKELEIRQSELMEQILFTSLEKIFIENRIYRDIEECETWESVLQVIDKGLEPFKPDFYRDITQEDIVKLTEIRIKRISKFDSFKADEQLKKLNDELKVVLHHLEFLTDYAIDWYKELKKKYGKDRERKTEIRSFESVEVAQVVVRNEKLYFDKVNGFVGYGIKTGEYICDCADIDDFIVFREDGTMMVNKVSDKSYVGKNAIYVNLWMRENQNTVYHMIYRDGKHGNYMVKRFQVKGITRDKDYDLTKGTKDSSVVYFSANPNGESELLTVYLKPKPRLKKQIFDMDLGEMAVKGRDSQGNILSKLPIRKIVRKSIGESTLDARPVWFDPNTRRFNTEERGTMLGNFKAGERAFVIQNNGSYRFVLPETSIYFEEPPLFVSKYIQGMVVTIVYQDKDKQEYFVKRFTPETPDKIILFLPENENVDMVLYSLDKCPRLQIDYTFGKNKEERSEVIHLWEFIAVKGETARGNRLNYKDIQKIQLIEPFETEETEDTDIASSDESADDSPSLEIDLSDEDPQITMDL